MSNVKKYEISTKRVIQTVQLSYLYMHISFICSFYMFRICTCNNINARFRNNIT